MCIDDFANLAREVQETKRSAERIQRGEAGKSHPPAPLAVPEGFRLLIESPGPNIASWRIVIQKGGDFEPDIFVSDTDARKVRMVSMF